MRVEHKLAGNHTLVVFSTAFENWAASIIKDQGLAWSLNVSADCGSTCFEKRIINCPDGHYALFLHEVAHAILGRRHTMTKNHDVIWADMFTALCDKYLAKT